jgi:phosphate acetyltransferase
MSDGLYVTGTEPATGKSAVALGVHELLARRVGRLGVFRPVVEARQGPDPVVDLLRPRAPDPAPYEASIGVSYADLHADETAALGEIVARFRALAAAATASWSSARTSRRRAPPASSRSTPASP